MAHQTTSGFRVSYWSVQIELTNGSTAGETHVVCAHAAKAITPKVKVQSITKKSRRPGKVRLLVNYWRETVGEAPHNRVVSGMHKNSFLCAQIGDIIGMYARK